MGETLPYPGKWIHKSWMQSWLWGELDLELFVKHLEAAFKIYQKAVFYKSDLWKELPLLGFSSGFVKKTM